MSRSHRSSVTILPLSGAENADDDKVGEGDSEKAQVVIEELEISTLPEPPKGWRKVLLITLLAGAMFFDIIAACSAMAALPTVSIIVVRMLSMV